MAGSPLFVTDSHVLGRDLPLLQLARVLVQLPGGPVAEVPVGQRVLHVQDVVLLKAQLLLPLRHALVKCSGDGEEALRRGPMGSPPSSSSSYTRLKGPYYTTRCV